MTFWFVITFLIFIALAIVLTPYWRKLSTNTLDNNELNILLYKRRLAELELDLSNDVLDQEQYDVAVSELKLQLLSDVPEDQKKIGDNSQQWSKQTVIVTFLFVPALSIGLYLLLGNKDIATGNVEVSTSQGPLDVEKMIAGLAKRLEAEPSNPQGWKMLGRSYAAVNQYDKSVIAYEKAHALAPKDVDVLTGLAEILAITHNNQLQGRPLELIEKALVINKNHPRALWLAGHAHAQQGNKQQAIKYWQTLLSSLPPEHESAQKVRQTIAQLGGQPESRSEAIPKKNEIDQDGTGIRVKVRLAKKFKHAVPKEATVFIFARAAKGPRIPLAGKKMRLSDLPAEIVLNDSNAMIPGRTISSVNQVIIGARISKNGGPVSKPGDLEGYSPVVSSAHPEILEILINQIAQ